MNRIHLHGTALCHILLPQGLRPGARCHLCCRCSVKSWDEQNGTWGYEGPRGLTGSTVSAVNTAWHHQLKAPVVCFQDSASNGKVSCMQYTGRGNAFVYLGPPGGLRLAG
jgi:hypothetical protein